VGLLGFEGCSGGLVNHSFNLFPTSLSVSLSRGRRDRISLGSPALGILSADSRSVPENLFPERPANSLHEHKLSTKIFLALRRMSVDSAENPSDHFKGQNTPRSRALWRSPDKNSRICKEVRCNAISCHCLSLVSSGKIVYCRRVSAVRCIGSTSSLSCRATYRLREEYWLPGRATIRGNTNGRVEGRLRFSRRGRRK
jgi:hypothetical protein